MDLKGDLEYAARVFRAALAQDHRAFALGVGQDKVAVLDIARQHEQAMMSQSFVHHWDEVEYFELALSHIDHMTEREKGRTRGTYYLTTRNYQKASEVYEQLVETYPFDDLGNCLLVLGSEFGSDGVGGGDPVDPNTVPPLEVRVDGRLIYSKLQTGEFPDEEKLIGEIG